MRMADVRYFDLHCDTPYECYFKKEQFYVNQLAISGKTGESFREWTQTFAVWIRDDAENPFLLYKSMQSERKK